MRSWFLTIIFLLAYSLVPAGAFAAPVNVDNSTSASAVANSAQRKTFFDSLNSAHWAFYYNGTAIEYSYSVDGESWTSAGTIPYDTASFSVVYKTIGGTSYVFVVAEANTYDVVLRRGVIGGTSLSFDAEQTIFNGTSSSDFYIKPTVAISENDHLWISTIKDSGPLVERFQVNVIRSTNTAEGDLSVLNAPTAVGHAVGELRSAVILPQNGDEMCLISSVDGTNIAGYIFDGAVWSSANTGGDYSWFSVGTSHLNSHVYVITFSGSDIYVGGNFIDAFGVASGDHIVKWDGIRWSALGSGLNASVFAIETSGSDVYAGGQFSDAGGVAAADYIAKWDGTSWSALGPALNNSVETIAISGSDVYVGGYFTNVDGIAAADYIARWDGASWNAVGGGLNAEVLEIVIDGTDIYVGGSFSNAGGIANADSIAIWDGANWNALGAGANSFVSAIAISGGDVYIGGFFTDLDGVAEADYIARWDGASWNALANGLNGNVFEITVNGSDVYVGGNFTDAGGIVEADGLARWDGSNWHALGDGLANAYAISISGNDVYVGGDFNDAGGIGAADRIALWNGATWSALGTGTSSTVRAIGIVGTDVYLGGQFQNVGGIGAADYIVRWDGAAWNAVGSGLSSTVLAIAVDGTDIYVGGQFSDAGGIAEADRFAKWDGATWSALGVTSDLRVNALVFSGNDLYVGGYHLEIVGSDQATMFAYYRGAVAADADLSSEISAVSDADGNVYLAYTDNSDQLRFRRYDEAGGTWGSTVTLNAAASGSPSLSYRSVGGRVTGSWVESGDVNFAHAISPYGGADWSSGEALYSIGTNSALTTVATQETADLPVVWTNGAANPYNILTDNIVMSSGATVTISSAAGSATNVSPIPVTITFSKDVTGFVVGDITVGNGTAGNFVAVNAKTYTVDITPTATGAVTVDVAANVAKDSFNLDSLAATQFMTTYDLTVPTVHIASTASNPTRIFPIPVTIQFSETVTGFAISDITVSNGNTSSFVAVDGDTFTVQVAPVASGLVLVDVAGAVAQDTAGNDNSAATQFSFTYDAIQPTVVISSTASNPTPTSPIPVVFEFSESVTGFAAEDIVVTNSTLGNFVAIDANSYSAKIYPSADGIVTVSIAASVAQDDAGNQSSVATTLSLNYQSPDSDGDGVSDATEANDGTNANDSGSFLAILPTSWCSEWNGYFAMQNINEYTNFSSNSRSLVETLYDFDGAASSAIGFSIDGETQLDILTHQMQGWQENSYGKVCSEVSNGSAGDVDGRMVYYKPNAKWLRLCIRASLLRWSYW